MRKQKRLLCRISALLLSALSSLSAASLAGTITYHLPGSGTPTPLANVLVTIYSEQAKTRMVTRTDGAGTYNVPGLRPGRYLILVARNGKQIYQGAVTIPTPQSNQRQDIAF